MTSIIPLSEGSFTIDQSKEFVPFNPDEDDLQARSRGSLLVEIQPFLIITDQDVLLLDTGLGFADKQGVLQLHRHIMSHDINPELVTKVLMSHLHKDHAGGITQFNSATNRYELSFPHATHYINRHELEEALKPGNPSYNPLRLAPLINNPKVVLLEDHGIIDDYIFHQKTAAHSPQHQVFHIHTDIGIIFFGGDDAPQLKQMKSRFVAKYDFDGKKAAELRNQWWAKGTEEHWTFLFYHDIQTPVTSC
jgi:glyoxylase-like metal-dependent hydrolase (beta-lactamase superfamily II)